MGFWTFLAGGVAATKAKNMLTRPSVNFISGDFEIVSMENIGIVGTEWRIWYRKKGSSSRSSFTVKKSTRSGNVGSAKYEVFWPGK
jgi:hypothetical protein|tara:strand:- start:1265 stop:1522 length:258 start_codon:yes stop_codon:yes gene_type:complete